MHFGYNDHRQDLRPHIYRRWREEWIANDRHALAGMEWKEMSARVTKRALEDASREKANHAVQRTSATPPSLT